jgi:hypothetical protein
MPSRVLPSIGIPARVEPVVGLSSPSGDAGWGPSPSNAGTRPPHTYRRSRSCWYVTSGSPPPERSEGVLSLMVVPYHHHHHHTSSQMRNEPNIGRSTPPGVCPFDVAWRSLVPAAYRHSRRIALSAAGNVVSVCGGTKGHYTATGLFLLGACLQLRPIFSAVPSRGPRSFVSILASGALPVVSRETVRPTGRLGRKASEWRNFLCQNIHSMGRRNNSRASLSRAQTR